MTVPSKEDIQKLIDKINKHKKSLNPDGSPKRPFDDNLAKALFRSAVREKWMYSDTKLSFLLESRIHDMDDSTRTKWLQKCNICKQTFKEADVEVDHKIGDNEFTEWNQAIEWATKILNVKHEDLQILCIPDHRTKTVCDSLGVDYRTIEGWAIGLLEQERIKVFKMKAKDQIQWLKNKGVDPGKNAEIREKQIVEVLNGLV